MADKVTFTTPESPEDRTAGVAMTVTITNMHVPDPSLLTLQITVGKGKTNVNEPHEVEVLETVVVSLSTAEVTELLTNVGVEWGTVKGEILRLAFEQLGLPGTLS